MGWFHHICDFTCLNVLENTRSANKLLLIHFSTGFCFQQQLLRLWSLWGQHSLPGCCCWWCKYFGMIYKGSVCCRRHICHGNIDQGVCRYGEELPLGLLLRGRIYPIKLQTFNVKTYIKTPSVLPLVPPGGQGRHGSGQGCGRRGRHCGRPHPGQVRDTRTHARTRGNKVTTSK